MIAPEGPFPLSAAQRGIWFAQHIAGDTPISIAQYVELSGEIDHTLLTEAVRQTGREFGTGYLRLVDVDGRPHQVVDLSLDDEIARVDCVTAPTRKPPRTPGCGPSTPHHWT